MDHLCAKFSTAKGGPERKKIKGGKARIILQPDDVDAVQDVMQQTEVRCLKVIFRRTDSFNSQCLAVRN